MKHIRFLFFLLLAAAVISLNTANAYQLIGVKWATPSATFHVDIPGADGLWNEAFEEAMDSWSSATVFQFGIVRETYSDPCDPDDSRNGVKFSATLCGDSWGSATLGICQYWYSNLKIFQADITFNSNKSWSVYSTPWKYDTSDFRRVAVHELGHALGLGHEDSGVLSIMRAYAGDITTPQPDDIAGVAAMYGSECTYGISPSTGHFPAAGGNSLVSVTASGGGCNWTTSESLSWVSLSAAGGTGSGTVTVTAAANTGSARSGSVTIAGQPYTISQDAAVNPAIEQVARLYVATFNRAPLQRGLEYWVYSSGLAIEDIARSFFDQPETQDLYPDGTSDADFVIQIYMNLFNREPALQGLEYWTGPDGLGGSITRDVMILATINGALAFNGTDADILRNKTEVGLYYAASGQTGTDFFLEWITDDYATVVAAKEAIDAR